MVDPQVAKHSDVNKMTVMNLATVFVHCVIRPEDEDPTLLMATASNRTQTVFLLITHHSEIFKVEYSAHGSLIAVDNLLEIDDGNYQHDKPFTVSSDSGVYSSVTSGKSFTEEVFDNIDPNYVNVGHSSSENLPQPLSPLSAKEDRRNKVGSRQGRVFPGYLENNSSGSDDEWDGPYTAIEELKITKPPPPPPAKPSKFASGDYCSADNDHYYFAKQQGMEPGAADGGDEVDGGVREDDGYSHIPCEGESVIMRPQQPINKPVCNSIADQQEEEDYSTLTDYTSLLRQKSSQMYKEDGEKNELVTGNNDNSGVEINNGQSSPNTVTEMYSKVVRRSDAVKQSLNGAAPSTSSKNREKKNENAPPIPPKRPVPSPRRSIRSQSVFFEQQTSQPVIAELQQHQNYHSKKASLTKAQSLDGVYSSIDDTLNDYPQRLNSVTSNPSGRGNTVRLKSSVQELMSRDLSEASREELLSHIEALHNELLDSSEKIVNLKKSHHKKVEEMAAKLDKEKNATQGAVDKVMDLQKKIEKYQMKFGSICD